ncbi:MAG: hypothetical protein WBA98_10480 [Gordonia sp. (in: high G+C Gram-positive bacteria)]|uniref:hypothetical protein n=1 Tax=Gordonia sp. (in: high G+C Gram-positive bacteria) TaxID=84139 RepID=UPI003C729314
MTVVVLFAVAIVVAAGAALVRRHLAADSAKSDGAVLATDVIATVVTLALLVLALIPVTRDGHWDGGWLVAIQVLAVVAAAVTGASAVRLVLAAGGIPTRGNNHDDEPDAPLRGGRIIGMLERTAVVVSLLLAWPAGIGVALAVKSLARFSELRAPRASEQFILGTFASVLWAAAFAGVAYLAGI